MTSNYAVRLAGWAAISSAATTVLMVAAAILTDALHLGNTFAVLLMSLMALMIAVALGLHLVLRSQGPVLSLASTAIGILGMLLTGLVHALKIAGTLTLEQFNAPGEGIGPGAIGLWLLVSITWRSGAAVFLACSHWWVLSQGPVTWRRALALCSEVRERSRRGHKMRFRRSALSGSSSSIPFGQPGWACGCCGTTPRLEASDNRDRRFGISPIGLGLAVARPRSPRPRRPCPR